MAGSCVDNSLILVKVLEDTQIGQTLKKSTLLSSRHHSPNHNSILQKSDRFVMKRNLETLRHNNVIILDSLQKFSTADEVFYENLTHIVKVISRASLEQTFYSLLEYFAFYLCVSELDHMAPFLAVAPNPYLSPAAPDHKYTLVLDFSEVFCLANQRKSRSFRPYSQHFLH